MKNEKMGEELYLSPEKTDDAQENSFNGNPVVKASDDAYEIYNANKKPKRIKTVEEIPEMRGSNHKVFRMSDGTEQAVFTPSAIHVFDEEAKIFKDVENTLTDDGDGRHFSCGKNNFKAKFSREDDNDELFTIEHGMHRVKVSARKNSKNKNKGVIPMLRKVIRDGAMESDALIYSEVEPNTDYEYTVGGRGVKENIIIKKPGEIYRYPFILSCENVTARSNDEKKTISFISNETGEEVFFIPTPFMIDANGIMSGEVNYGMKDVGNGVVHLTVTADSDFINAKDRAFPVTVDPEIQLAGSSAMTTYSWDNGYIYTPSVHTVGTTGNGDGACNSKRMYISFNMPSLPRNPRIKKAELIFSQHSYSTACEQCAKFGLFQVNGEIDTGACTPIDDSNLIDYAKIKAYSGENGDEITYAFDVTTLIDRVNKNEVYIQNLVMKMLSLLIYPFSVLNTLLFSLIGGAFGELLSIFYLTIRENDRKGTGISCCDEGADARFFITGDKHRRFDKVKSFCREMNTRRKDVLIVLGDAGFNYYGDKRDEKLKKEISALRITLFCLHGNKENRPQNVGTYGIRNFCGGKVYYEPKYPNIYFAIDGEIYTFEGRKYIAVGGAHSVDRMRCIMEGTPFWHDEMPDDTVKETVEHHLQNEGNKIYGIMTHTCPIDYLPTEMFMSTRQNANIKREPKKVKPNKLFKPDIDRSTEIWLGELEKKIDYEVWFCGHYHIDKQIDKIQMMYNNIRPLHIQMIQMFGDEKCLF